ncbi:MmgE/PrpD family protein [Microbacterium pygmaeum]|uniref:2-methylcitrate dehydratase n=1 Tax=Microbacterium pygmaeum TaxID=370764 RepID=A0A1G7XAZ0_9MICO|nr:MmgE/PrpD family protein [Microbacterium pygmaeum]SDG81425.1 2-methylcitrate dehydratase [Microbacterium pygmaeum]
MDTTLERLVDFVDSVETRHLAPQTVEQVVRHVVDTVGCGAGGFRSEPAAIARSVVEGTGGPLVASVYGQPEKILVDCAGFVNGAANRYLDFNDFGSSGHPSDMIAVVLAAAEATRAGGSEVVAGVYTAYEVATTLAESVPATGGWDQGIFSSLGVAAGLARVFGLSRQQTANALSLAIVPSAPLKVTRYGQLSEWKAAAVPHASMTASFATRLARAGMTGPPEPFEGKFGLFEQVWEPFDLRLGSAVPSAIERSSLKRFGACYWGQVAIDIVTRLRVGLDLERVESIEVVTCDSAYRAIGGGVGDHDAKWRPSTRETADHSMPFLVASALRDGAIGEATYADERLSDRRLLAVMDRITVTGRDDLTARSTRDRCPTSVTITLSDGTVVEHEQDFPRGHPANPMSDSEVAAKFDDLVSEALPAAASADLSGQLWDLPALSSLEGIAAHFRSFGAD